VSISPRDRFITIYGRMPVLEALRDARVPIEKVLVARNARGESVDGILAAAADRGLAVQRVTPERVTRLSRNGRHDQGVVADVEAPGIVDLADWLSAAPPTAPARLFVLDGITNPANVGQILRVATAAGLDGVVLPRAGCPEVGPLVIKASAGVVFQARILRSATATAALDALSASGYALYGLRGTDADCLWDVEVARRAAFVLGNESEGVSGPAADRINAWVGLPLANGVESLNVASAAAAVSYELARRRRDAS
jgi:23S rRNA (guanosine2251-2'-O)-methyltransferase